MDQSHNFNLGIRQQRLCTSADFIENSGVCEAILQLKWGGYFNYLEAVHQGPARRRLERGSSYGREENDLGHR